MVGWLFSLLAFFVVKFVKKIPLKLETHESSKYSCFRRKERRVVG